MPKLVNVIVIRCGKDCPANTEGEWCNILQNHLLDGDPFPPNCPLPNAPEGAHCADTPKTE